MGAEQSITEGIVKSKNFTIVGCKESNIYGQHKLIEHKEHQYVMSSKTCQTYEEFNQLRGLLNKQKALNEIPYFIKLVEIDTQEEDNLCSTFYKVTAIYDYYEQTLRQVQKEIPINCLYVLKSLSECLKLFNENGINHGNVTPDYILVDKQIGQIKMNNCTELTGYNHYKKVMLTDNDWYLSPELVAALGKKEMRPQYDIEKNDVFSIGLIALDLWGIGEIQQIYDKQNYQVNQNILNNLLDEFGVKNGYVLKNVVRQILSIDPNQRPTLNELYTSLSELYQIQQQINYVDNQQTEIKQIEMKEENYEDQNNYQQQLIINKESFAQQDQIQQDNNNQINQNNHIIQNDQLIEDNHNNLDQPFTFEDSPQKKKKQTIHNETDQQCNPIKQNEIEQNQNGLVSVQSSIKDFYVTGSIAAQFGQFQGFDNEPENKVLGTLTIDDNLILQEKSLNQSSVQTSPKGQESFKQKKNIVTQKSVNKVQVSIKRPKHEIVESKLPKQAVVVTKRR